MTTSASKADVATERPARFGKQLAAHLGRRGGGSWSDDDQQGHVELGAGRLELSCTTGVLHLDVQGPADDLDRLEDVVGRHLVRFGARDELFVQWVRADGTAGSEQRNTED